MEFVFPPADPSQALRDGVVDFYGGSPYTGLHRFPGYEAAPSCAPFRIIPIGSWQSAPISNVNGETSVR